MFGLPRSGTTLTEQVLASHSQVFGAGELPLASEVFGSLPDVLNEKDAGVRVPRPSSTAKSAREVAGPYLERLERRWRTAPRVADKMPENYQYLGLLAALFPRAKFIHCRRDIRDVAVSCWMTNFRQVPWANDPEHIASRFHAYRRLIEHWRRVLPVPLLEVDYEETVADLEGMARRLLAWCGLGWEPGCLAFHERFRAGAHGERDPGPPADLRAFGGPLEALRASSRANLLPIIARLEHFSCQ